MTTETIAATDTGSGFTPAEDAYFASGGEGTIPEEGSTAAPAGGAADPAAAAAAIADPAVVAAKGNDNVPLARFLEEKKSRKALETQVAELRGKFSIIEKLNAPAAGADPAAPVVPPTAEDDIFGAVKHVGETVAQMQKRLDDADAATKAQTEQTEFVSTYRKDADAFTVKTPDYKAAYDFLLQGRAAELMAIGYDNPNDPTLTPDEQQAAFKALHDALVADEFAVAQMAIGKKKSPAETLYGLAKQRGYKAAAPGAPAAGAEPSKGAAILDQIEKGQQEHKSLTTPAGATGDAGMTAERLIAMPMDEFQSWCDKNPAAAKRIMGG